MAARVGLFTTAIAMARLIEAGLAVIVMSPGLMPAMVLAMAVASAYGVPFTAVPYRPPQLRKVAV